MIKLKPKTDTFEQDFYEFVWQIFDQIDLFLNDHMKHNILNAMFANYAKMREELREKVNTPKTRRFFQLFSELFNMERGIYTWIGIAHTMSEDKSIEELTKEMMLELANNKYQSKKIEWQILQSEVADLFDPSDFATILKMSEEILNLQRQSCLASGKYIGTLLYQAFTVPNEDVLRSYLNVELDPAEF